MTTNSLPPKALLKFNTMRDAVEETHERVLSIQRRIKETEAAIRNLNPEQEDERAPYLADLKRLADRQEAEQYNFQSMGRCFTAITTWVNQTRAELSDVPEREYAKDDGDDGSLLASVERCRAHIAALQGAKASISRAVPPIEVLYQAADAHVEELVKRGTPSLLMDRDQLSIRHNVDGFGHNASDGIVFLAWLHPDEFKMKLREQVDVMRAEEQSRQVPVLAVAERRKQVSDLSARILELEREEEFFICQAAEYGTNIPRRENASAQAILCVEFRKVIASKAQVAA
jgi:hypothetical protein